MHTAANEVVALALRHAAQVVIEDLSGARARRRGRGRFNRLLGRSQQHKLQRVLEYKLALAGLPRALHVHPAHTFETCPECGLRDAENRKRRLARAGLRPEIFSCVDCGHSADAHLNAARVIGKPLGELRVVMSGAGAAGVAVSSSEQAIAPRTARLTTEPPSAIFRAR